jgi:hypothetical protein
MLCLMIRVTLKLAEPKTIDFEVRCRDGDSRGEL